MLDDSNLDYRYYAAMGWLESDYFYPARLGTLKKAVGRLFDSLAPVMFRMLS